MKAVGILMILAGVGSAAAIYMYDIAVKHEVSVTLGPRSGPALGVAVLVLIAGIILVASAGRSSSKGKPPAAGG